MDRVKRLKEIVEPREKARSESYSMYWRVQAKTEDELVKLIKAL